MTEHRQLQIEYFKAKNTTKIKIILGVAGCVTVIVLAFMFQTLALAIITPFGLFYLVKQAISLNDYRQLRAHAVRQSEAQTKSHEAKAAGDWETVNQQKEITAQLAMAKYIHNTTAGTFLIGGDRVRFYPKQSSRKQTTVQPEVKALLEPKPNILDVMKTWTMPLVVNGPQQSGKTNCTISIAYSLGIDTILVSLRNEPQYHFDSMDIYSEEQRPGSIQRGFEACLDTLATYEPMALILDDFINLGLMLADNKQLELLIATIATQAISHKKRVFFTMQSSTKNDFGLKRLGAGLKQNFALLEIQAPLKDQNLNIISLAQVGILYEPGDWDNGPAVVLPGKVEFEIKSQDDLFKADYLSEMSQNKLIAKWYGSSNKNTRRACYERVIQCGMQWRWGKIT